MCSNAPVDWDDLRYVLAVSRSGTLSRAAESLSASHTTVGRRVRAIEEALGVRLFDATPDGFVATAAGRDLTDVAERMEAEVHALQGRVLGRDERLEGGLRVATMDLLFRIHHDAFMSFSTRYPSVELTVVASDAKVSLTRREADVALRMTNAPPEHLVGRKVGRVDFAVYGSKALVARIGEGAPLEAFPWLGWDERLNMQWHDDFLAQKAPGARIVMRMGFSSLLIHDAVTAGIGVHFLACADGDADLALTRLAPVEPAFSQDVWALTLPDLRHTSRVRAFLDHLHAHLAG